MNWIKCFKPPFVYHAEAGTYILDSEDQPVIEIRGWGLFSCLHGSLTAQRMQDKMGFDIAEMLNRLVTAQECDATESESSTTDRPKKLVPVKAFLGKPMTLQTGNFYKENQVLEAVKKFEAQFTKDRRRIVAIPLTEGEQPFGKKTEHWDERMNKGIRWHLGEPAQDAGQEETNHLLSSGKNKQRLMESIGERDIVLDLDWNAEIKVGDHYYNAASNQIERCEYEHEAKSCNTYATEKIAKFLGYKAAQNNTPDRTIDECFKKAETLAIDISDESNDLPAEYIFYKEGIIELIKFCKGNNTPDWEELEEEFRRRFGAVEKKRLIQHPITVQVEDIFNWFKTRLSNNQK